MFNNEERLFLLKVIEKEGNLLPLTKKHSYLEIAKEIATMAQGGLVEYRKGTTVLTELGRREMNRLGLVIDRHHNRWILPLSEFRMEKLLDSDIYIPELNVIENIRKDIGRMVRPSVEV